MAERLWEFKYQPSKWEDLIINDDLKETLRKNLDERPNMLLYGPPGCGKGSYIDVLINHNEIKGCTLKINASLEGGIDTIRDKVRSFAQAANFELGKLKLVYLNEADHPNLQAAQQSLRALIEETNKITQWIFACNYSQYVIPEIKSRCQVFNITNPPANEIFAKCEYILKNEGVKYKKKTIVDLIKKTYPDIRSTINTLRRNSINGKLQENIEFSSADKIFESILESMQTGDPEKVRKILKSNTIYYPQLYEFLYNKLMTEDKVFKDDAEAILLVGEHLHRDSHSSIKEINFMHMIFKMLKNGVI